MSSITRRSRGGASVGGGGNGGADRLKVGGGGEASTHGRKSNNNQKKNVFLSLPVLLVILLVVVVGVMVVVVDPRYENQKPIYAEDDVLARRRPTAIEVALENAEFMAENEIYILTGAYGGLGKETAKAIVVAAASRKRSCQLILAGRDPKKLKDLTEESNTLASASASAGGSSSGDSTVVEVKGSWMLDLADLQSVQEFAHQVWNWYNNTYDNNTATKKPKITIINNAATIGPFSTTAQGIEKQMGVNVVGHFLLNKLLVKITKRQVWVSSISHDLVVDDRPTNLDLDWYKHQYLHFTSGDSSSTTSSSSIIESYDLWRGYQQSKLGNILLAKEFHRRYFAGQQLETASLHPGVIWTDIGKDVYGDNAATNTTSSSIMTQLTSSIGGVLELLWDTILELNYMWGCEGWWFLKTPSQGAATIVMVSTMSSTQLQQNNGGSGYYKDCVLHKPAKEALIVQDGIDLFDWCNEITKNYQ